MEPLASHEIAAEGYSRKLLDHRADGRKVVGTWLNHYTVEANRSVGTPIDHFTTVGIDGILLHRLVDAPVPRTSADLVLPRLLRDLPGGSTVGLFGAEPDSLEAACEYIAREYRHIEIQVALNGYDHDLADYRTALEGTHLDVLILGLGAPTQDAFSLSIADSDVDILLTCGGWIDQVWREDYYPGWAYPMRLNWLVRLAREPRRLYRRYTFDAVRAVRNRHQIRSYLDDARLG